MKRQYTYIMLILLLMFVVSPGCQKSETKQKEDAAAKLKNTASVDKRSTEMLNDMLQIPEQVSPVESRPERELIAEDKADYPETNWDDRFKLEELADSQDTITPMNLEENNAARQIEALNSPEMADQTISLNFEDVDIQTIIKTVSDITNINFIIDDQVKGPVTVVCPGEIKIGELYSFLESVLDIQGYAAIPTGNHVKVISKKNASSYNMAIHKGTDPSTIEQSDRIITQMMTLQYADATEASALLKPILNNSNNISVYKKSNTLIITDTSSIIHHIARIIKQIDVPGARKEFSRVPLRYASAAILSKQITDLMNQSGSMTGAAANVQIQADSRTNSLLIIAGRRDMETIYEMIKKLDVVHSADNSNIHVIPLLNAEAKTVAEALQHLDIPRLSNTEGTSIKITPFEDTNTLIVAAAMPDFNLIETIVKQLDVIQEQISIDLLIVEVSEGDLQELGIDWATLDNAVSDSMRYFASTNHGIRVDSMAGNYDGLTLGAFKSVDGTIKSGAVLNALKRITAANVISSPNVVTSNHKEATFQAGDNIPYLKDSRITENSDTDSTVIKTYDYKDIGVNLQITPHINQGELIRLVIDSEFTQQKDSLTGLGAETPTLSKRKINTEITMVDGASIVIGGLIRDENNETVNGIPIISNIPFVGELFKSRSMVKQKSNLLLFITPRIIRSPGDAAELSRSRLNTITTKGKSEQE